MEQMLIQGADTEQQIQGVLAQWQVTKYLLVCDAVFPHLPVSTCFQNMKFPFVLFDAFTSNPVYEDICTGVDLFRAEHCDAIVAVGGGSAIDVAKCIKLFCKMDRSTNYLKQEYRDSGVPLMAVPTTAGTGSESTRFAVAYYKEEKQSIAHDSLLPNCAVLDARSLKSLPLNQKKCTLLDALCQGIESWWSVNSTAESKQYAEQAVRSIMEHYQAYLQGGHEGTNRQIMLAANFAGRAINITQTTAAHAMSYKLTSLYGFPHGHAVALCLPVVWNYMNEHPDHCIDPRGSVYLESVFQEIAETMGFQRAKDAVSWFLQLLRDLGIERPKETTEKELDHLAASVNPVRLKNNPVALSEQVLYRLYHEIVQ